VDGPVGTEYVVEGEHVLVTELFDPLAVGPEGSGVSTDFGLRKHNANLHGQLSGCESAGD
jgi:hypothetical protein